MRHRLRHPGRPAAGRREPPRGGQRVGGVLGVRPRPSLPHRRWRSACSPRSAASTRRSPRPASCSAPPTSPTPSARTRSCSRASSSSTPTGSTPPSCASSASPTSATCTTTPGSSRWRRGAWRSSRRGGWTCPPRCAGSTRPSTPRSSKADDVLGVPFLCDVADMLGALGDLDGAERYLARAIERDSMFSGQVLVTKFILDARQGILGDVDAGPAQGCPDGLVAGQARRRLRDGRQRRPRRRHRHARRRPARAALARLRRLRVARRGSASPPSSTRSWSVAPAAVSTTADAPVQPCPPRRPPAPESGSP